MQQLLGESCASKWGDFGGERSGGFSKLTQSGARQACNAFVNARESDAPRRRTSTSPACESTLRAARRDGSAGDDAPQRGPGSGGREVYRTVECRQTRTPNREANWSCPGTLEVLEVDILWPRWTPGTLLE